MGTLIFCLIWFGCGVVALPFERIMYKEFMGADYSEDWEKKQGFTVADLIQRCFIVMLGTVSLLLFGGFYFLMWAERTKL